MLCKWLFLDEKPLRVFGISLGRLVNRSAAQVYEFDLAGGLA